MKRVLEIFSAPQLRAHEWIVLGSLVLMQSIWNFFRVASVGPAILGDEYIYSQSARHSYPWGPQITGDFSNYLFNVVYSATNFCGPNFYTCGKIINLFFFAGFLFVLFVVAIKVLPVWPSIGFVAAAGLSPLTVYTSMFLPETMYFFFLALVLLAAINAAKNQTWQGWSVVGFFIGVASLVKPHSWMALIPISIFVTVLALSNGTKRISRLSSSLGALFFASLLSRLTIGFIVAGPKSLSFFGTYLSPDTIQQATQPPKDLVEGESAIGTSPITGVFELFWPQITVHVLSVSALMAVAIVGVIVGMANLHGRGQPQTVHLLALLSFIWLCSMILVIVVFTGWLTGVGDDHTTRVLLRYYDFLFILVPLAGLAVFVSKAVNFQNVFLRWILVISFGFLITNAFTGFFGSLTIQIADAPNLAGLVVNLETFNGVAMSMALGLAVFATFPKYTKWTFLVILPFSMVFTGWQIQDQYQGFRGEPSAADRAGKFINTNLSEEDKRNIHILASTRFDATNVAIWVDEPKLEYELGSPGSVYDADLAPKKSNWIVALSDIQVQGQIIETIPGEGYSLYRIR